MPDNGALRKIITCDANGLALGVDICAFTLKELDIAALVSCNEADGLHNGAKLDRTNSTAWQERGEQEVISRRNNHLRQVKSKVVRKTEVPAASGAKWKREALKLRTTL